MKISQHLLYPGTMGTLVSDPACCKRTIAPGRRPALQPKPGRFNWVWVERATGPFSVATCRQVSARPVNEPNGAHFAHPTQRAGRPLQRASGPFHQPFNCIVPAKEKCRAFSLLEIMVAVALLAIIIVGLLAMFFQVQRAFRAGTSQVDVMEAGRSFMSSLPREVQQLTASGLPYTTNLHIIGAANATDTVQILPSGAERFNYLQDFSFLSRAGDIWTGTAYRFSNAVSGVGTLYRLTSAFTNDSHPDINSIGVSNLSEFVCRASPYDPVPPGTPPLFRPVLDGIVRFSVLGYDVNGRIFTNWSKQVIREFVVNDAYTNGILPAYLDIEVAILRPETLAKFKARLDPSAPYPQSIERASNYLAKQIGNTDIFRQRVAIRPAATDVGAARVTSFP